MPSSCDELFPLSWLSQYGYCPRRCGLLALEQQWIENAETASGRDAHRRVHEEHCERHGENLYLYELSVFSRELGVNGKCDCIEAYSDPQGTALPYGEGKYVLYPIEYKHGVVRQEEEYHIQLCAQAMCLESQFRCQIRKGAVFYTDAHRRDEVVFNDQLRLQTRQTAAAVAELLRRQELPAAHYSAKCGRCSMLELCQPKWKRSARKYCSNLWELVCGEEDI